MNNPCIIEQRVALRLVNDILKAGHMISVHEGGDWAIKRSTDRKAIIAAMASTDSDTLVVRNASGDRLGSILLIYGNGRDLISDHTDTPEIGALVAGASALAEALS